ncbi:MAG TPA: hypothetical protein VGG44_08565 [Tepidisphaeraceae bacterium]|jgi:hypothetical protein
MKRKSIGWIALPACLVAVSIAIHSGHAITPRTAQAASFKSRANLVPSETTQACQDVINQMIAMQQATLDKKRLTKINPLTADDQLVAQEYQLDMSKCPADFQLAMFRFMMTEDTARLHAHRDKTSQAEKILAAVIEASSTRGYAAPKLIPSPGEYRDQATDQQKKDLANMVKAWRDVALIASKYGAK